MHNQVVITKNGIMVDRKSQKVLFSGFFLVDEVDNAVLCGDAKGHVCFFTAPSQSEIASID